MIHHTVSCILQAPPTRTTPQEHIVCALAVDFLKKMTTIRLIAEKMARRLLGVEDKTLCAYRFLAQETANGKKEPAPLCPCPQSRYPRAG
jgi:hypothetical protein